MVINSQFASLFKKYRLRSEIESLREFSDLMAAEGVVYDNTIYTRWQKGQRVPKDRKTIMKMLEVFVKRGGILRLSECNKLLESVHLRDLTSSEASKILQSTNHMGSNISLAACDIFVSRQSIEKDICWELICNRSILLYGHSGIGKTTLALHTLNILQNKFAGGCYWFEVNNKSPEMVIDEILIAFNKKPTLYPDVNEKISSINSILRDLNILVVLDNLLYCAEDILLLFKLKGPIIFTSIHYFATKHIKSINIPMFTKIEYYELASQILGEDFVNSHKQQLVQIGRGLGYIPMAGVLLMKQIAKDPTNIADFISQLSRNKINENREEISNFFNVILKNIDNIDRCILSAASIFIESSFSLVILSAITEIDIALVSKTINKMCVLSFVQRVKSNRYKMHPLLSEIMVSKPQSVDHRKKLLIYYESRYNTIKYKESTCELFIGTELNNIDNLRYYYYERGEYRNSIKCWNLIRNHLFTAGKWSHLLSINKQVESSYIKTENFADLAYFYIEDLGKIYYFQATGNNRALLYAKKGLQIAKRLGRKDLVSLGEQKLGILATESLDLYEAKRLLIHAAEYFMKIESYYQLMFTHIYLGHVYYKLNNFSKALDCFNYVTNNKMTPKEVCAVAYTCTAALQANTGNTDIALELVEKSLILGKELNLKLSNGLAYTCLAQIYAKRGQKAKASSYMFEAQKILANLNTRPRPNSIWDSLTKINN